MQQKQLTVELRSKTGKGISHQLRKADLVPGVVYGKGMDPMPISVKYRELQAALQGGSGHNNLITLNGGGTLDSSLVILSDLQQDPVKHTFLHVDFHRVNMTEKVRVVVPVKLNGTAIGVKEGGLLDLAHHELHVECLPGSIPDCIEIDITALKVAHSIHVNEISLPAGVKLLDDAKIPVVSILGRAAEETAAEA